MAENNGLTYDQIADMGLAALPDIRKGVNQTQTYAQYPVNKELIPWLNSDNVNQNVYGEQIHMRQAVGSISKHREYARHEAVHGTYMVRNSVSLCKRIDTAVSLDMLEEELQGKGDIRLSLYDLLEVRESARDKAIMDQREYDLLSAPPTSTLAEEFLGLAYWFGKSVDGSGNFVEQTEPDFVGTRTRFEDGSVTTTFGKDAVDASSLENRNYRSMLFTHNKTVDETMIDNWVEAMELQGWEKIDKVKGKLMSPVWFSIMPTIMQRQIRNIVNAQGSDDGDVYKKRVTKIYGERIHRSQVLDNDPSLPCYCVNKNELRLKKGRNLWDKYIEKERIGSTAYLYPMVYVWQLFVANRRSMGFCAHGDWST